MRGQQVKCGSYRDWTHDGNRPAAVTLPLSVEGMRVTMTKRGG